MAVQMSALAPSETELAPGQKGTSFRNFALDHHEPLVFDRPLTMIWIHSTSEAEQATPTAYVIRYVFGTPMQK